MPFLISNWRLIAGAGFAVLIAVGVWFYGHTRYAAGKAACERSHAAAALEAQKRMDSLETALRASNEARDAALAGQASAIAATGDRSSTIILRESANAPRYASADCSLTPGVLDAINDSRRSSHSGAPGDGREPVPAG